MPELRPVDVEYEMGKLRFIQFIQTRLFLSALEQSALLMQHYYQNELKVPGQQGEDNDVVSERYAVMAHAASNGFGHLYLAKFSRTGTRVRGEFTRDYHDFNREAKISIIRNSFVDKDGKQIYPPLEQMPHPYTIIFRQPNVSVALHLANRTFPAVASEVFESDSPDKAHFVHFRRFPHAAQLDSATSVGLIDSIQSHNLFFNPR